MIIPGKITNGQAKCPHHKYSISTFFTIHPIKNGTTINEMYNSMVASDRVYNRLPQSGITLPHYRGARPRMTSLLAVHGGQ